MQFDFSQRWRSRRASFRPPGEVIDPRLYEVAPLAGDAASKAFVLEHHYSRTYPAARFRFGLFRAGVLQGVAVFSHPVNDAVLTSVFPGVATDSIELGRLVLLDEVPFIIPRAELLRLAAPLRRVEAPDGGIISGLVVSS